MSQPLSVQQILQLAQRGDENTRANAVKALYNLATPESGQALRLLLRDPSEPVRKIATQAFQQLEAHLGGPGSIPPLPSEANQGVPASPLGGTASSAGIPVGAAAAPAGPAATASSAGIPVGSAAAPAGPAATASSAGIPVGSAPPPSQGGGDAGLAGLLGGGATSAAARQVQAPQPTPVPQPAAAAVSPEPVPVVDAGLAGLLGGSSTSAAAVQVQADPPPVPQQTAPSPQATGGGGLAGLVGGATTSAAAAQVEMGASPAPAPAAPGPAASAPAPAGDHAASPAFQNFERARSGYQDMEERLESAYEALERLRDGALAQGIPEGLLTMPALPGRWAAEEYAQGGGPAPAATAGASPEGEGEAPPTGRLTPAHRELLGQVARAAALGQSASPPEISEAERLQLRGTAVRLLSPCLEVCLEGLHDPRGELAQSHARALGLLPVAGAFEALADCIRGQRMEPAFFEALGEIRDPEAISLLKDIYTQDRFTFARQFIVHAMARLPGEEADQFLLQALDDPDPSIQTSTANHIAVCGRTQLAGALLSKLGQGRDNTDVSLAKALVTLQPGDTKVVQALQERLSQTDPEGRLGKALITALGRTRHPDALGGLQPYTKSRDRRLKALAIEAVCELEIPAEQKIKLLNPALREVNLRGESDPKGRAQAAVKVAGLGAETARETLKEMAQSQDPEVLAWGCWGLGEVAHEQGLGLLRKALGSNDTNVKIQALKALGSLADPRAAEAIAGLGRDPSDEVRSAAVEALARLGSAAHSQVSTLLEAEYRPDVLAPCLRSLAATDPNPPSCWRRVEEKIEDDEATVRLAATEAAARLIHDEALPALLERLQDSEHKVRRVAGRALWSYGEVRLVPRVLDLLADEDDEVRLGGALVLVELGELHRDLSESTNAGRLVAGLRASPPGGSP